MAQTHTDQLKNPSLTREATQRIMPPLLLHGSHALHPLIFLVYTFHATKKKKLKLPHFLSQWLR